MYLGLKSSAHIKAVKELVHNEYIETQRKFSLMESIDPLNEAVSFRSINNIVKKHMR